MESSQEIELNEWLSHWHINSIISYYLFKIIITYFVEYCKLRGRSLRIVLLQLQFIFKFILKHVMTKLYTEPSFFFYFFYFFITIFFYN